jgi:predicted flap endonuclease-1-like 5' DNA nuclease
MHITEIEGIGPAYGAKLEAAGVKTVGALLRKGAHPEGREALAFATGLSEVLIRDWVNHADLMRVGGIGPQFAEMLEESGVDSVPALAQRNAENLQKKLDEINERRNIANRTPCITEVQRWISEAKTLPRIVTH